MISNHITIEDLDKESVQLKFTLGKKLTPVNVFYGPNIIKNLIYVILLNNNGFKIALEVDKVNLTKSRVFVEK